MPPCWGLQRVRCTVSANEWIARAAGRGSATEYPTAKHLARACPAHVPGTAGHADLRICLAAVAVASNHRAQQLRQRLDRACIGLYFVLVVAGLADVYCHFKHCLGVHPPLARCNSARSRLP